MSRAMWLRTTFSTVAHSHSRQFKENEVYYGRWPTFVLQKSVHLILRVYLMKTRANSATPGFECRASPMTSIQLA